jgi:hypothetical protein
MENNQYRPDRYYAWQPMAAMTINVDVDMNMDPVRPPLGPQYVNHSRNPLTAIHINVFPSTTLPNVSYPCPHGFQPPQLQATQHYPHPYPPQLMQGRFPAPQRKAMDQGNNTTTAPVAPTIKANRQAPTVQTRMAPRNPTQESAQTPAVLRRSSTASILRHNNKRSQSASTPANTRKPPENKIHKTPIVRKKHGQSTSILKAMDSVSRKRHGSNISEDITEYQPKQKEAKNHGNKRHVLTDQETYTLIPVFF